MSTDHAARDATLRAELLKRAREILPLLRHNAARCERERRIADENLAMMQDAGLFRILHYGDSAFNYPAPPRRRGFGPTLIKCTVTVTLSA